MSRKKRRRWLTLAVVVVSAVVVTGTAVYFFALRGSGTADVQYITSEVTTGSVSETIDADFTLVSSKSDTALSPGVSGVVTRQYIAVGDKLKSLERLAVISGEQVFALVSSTPLYEDLAVGDTSANVKALEKALKAKGYDHGEVDGYFDSTTEDGLIDWQADNNLDETGTIDLETFVWVPEGSEVTAVSATTGSNVSGAGGLAIVSFPRALKAQASVGQADVSSLKKGLQATLVVDGHDDEVLTGTITSVGSTTSSSSSSATTMAASSTTTTAQYTIELSVADLPSWALSGMSGSLTLTIDQVSDVIVVPTSAIEGTASSPYVRVLSNGEPVNRSVETGMTTSSLTEITSGLTEGEKVITGEIVAGESTADDSSSGSLLQGAGGGAMPSGAGMPGGAMPGGGGQ